jgi:uncharacterized protein YecE (DUF72 family)
MSKATIYIGTSGFSYREWVGSFYPRGMKAPDMLSFYASHLNAVELNNTFYQLPSEASFSAWRKCVGPDFRFAVKASQTITHRKDFGVQSGALKLFMSRITPLGDRLGPVLFQFPPSFGKQERLNEFVGHLRRLVPESHSARIAIELRNKKLLNRSCFDFLNENNLSLCLNDAHLPPEEWPEPRETAYLRLRNGPYEPKHLRKFASLLARWAEQGIECYVFFKHEAGAPELARAMRALLG